MERSLTLREIAGYVGLSTSALSAKFKAATGRKGSHGGYRAGGIAGSKIEKIKSKITRRGKRKFIIK